MKKLLATAIAMTAACGAFAAMDLGNVANVEISNTNANNQLDIGNIGIGNIGNNGNIRQDQLEIGNTGTGNISTLATIDDLVEEVRELSLKYAALTSAVAFIEHKCETDATWRKAYHQGEAAQTVATNEYGIAYRVTIYKDGYVYADCPMVVSRPKSPEDAAKAEAERKALIASKVEEARQAMERASLPKIVADILAERRAAAQTKEVTVIVEPDK